VHGTLRVHAGCAAHSLSAVQAVDGSLIAQKRDSQDPLLEWRGRGRLPKGESVDTYLARISG
jgi:hypothetical protein